ncbi:MULTISPECIES: dGTP triphosphohydrolase [unclassified Actinopolyspora]|uniref:deoxyguanosinetriphosphate triphosphohydrolase family protein n=1 Tax=unclassified Actinopolyspora TaxID=2639451 RepID=UPI0013F625E2|nr:MULTISPECIES: dNTP triphosphohydrolase [unclassified Actinopolyspora]NHD17644.1 dNTP triphosphohydrolase [Actinopolyspora sp. BKK2]NHE76623.1 dNTP triphosphohydrolase [Actinopolyspora sp. BKK1]
METDPPTGRTARRSRTGTDGNAEHGWPNRSSDLAASPFRADRDRVSGSAFFARLGGVTQVVSPSGSGLLLHNRLTHSLKVAQVARALAESLLGDAAGRDTMNRLGGCDLDVVEGAGLAHDLGHPPFGHLGERVLDRIARQRFGLADGFEGNAQTFRIVSSIDVRGGGGDGLDLTAALRAALLKYPWTRFSRPDPHPSSFPVPPRGASAPEDAPETGAAKFSCYSTELDDMLDCRSVFSGRLESWQQSVEASVMDTADDIAYAIHDLEDFHRVGILQHATVSTELTEWLGRCAELAHLDEHGLQRGIEAPGYSLESLRRRLRSKDSWIADDEAFVNAVKKVQADLVTKLLEQPFDRSKQAEQAVAAFSGNWTRRLVDGVRVDADPTTRSGHVTLDTEQWHEVQILKFVHRRFVLQRPDLALHQRGQDRLLSKLVQALDEWLIDRSESARLPHRLRDLFEHAAAELEAVHGRDPELLGRSRSSGPADEVPEGERLERMARGRAVIDFVASLTDEQAAALLESLSGRTTQLWSDTFVL